MRITRLGGQQLKVKKNGCLSLCLTLTKLDQIKNSTSVGYCTSHSWVVTYYPVCALMSLFWRPIWTAVAILSVSILGRLYDWLRLLSKYLAVNPNEMDWHCGEQSFERELWERKKTIQAPINRVWVKNLNSFDIYLFKSSFCRDSAGIFNWKVSNLLKTGWLSTFRQIRCKVSNFYRICPNFGGLEPFSKKDEFCQNPQMSTEPKSLFCL